MRDPAQAVCDLLTLSRQLSALIAVTHQPDIKQITETATEIRERAQIVRMWAFERNVDGRTSTD